MSQSEQFDKQNNDNEEAGKAIDTYRTQTQDDIYNTPDVSGDVSLEADAVEDIAGEDSTQDMVGTGTVGEAAYNDGDCTSENDGEEGTATWSTAQEPADVSDVRDVVFQDTVIDVSGDLQGGNSPYANASYGSQAGQNNTPYSSAPYYGGANGDLTYGNNPYGGQGGQNYNPYGGQAGQNYNPYGGQAGYNGNPYDGQAGQNYNPYGSQAGHNGNSYGGQTGQNNHPYGSQYYGQAGQGNGQYGSMPGNNQYGVPPYGDNQYSPYAAPVKKNNTGLIIGIVVAVIFLFLLAVGALTYKVFSMYADERNSRRHGREEYDFDDDWDRERADDDNDLYDEYDYDYDDYYGYDDYDYDYDDEYYSLRDDIRTDLSYSVDFDYFEYESEYDNVNILVSYPIISGDSVPNLEQLNSEIRSEVDLFTEYFEEEYEQYLTEEDYFDALSTSYVTYMDEEKMSIVFSEYVYSDYYNDVFLYCINIDMENGVILDNENIISADDDFSVEFRKRSDIQNGEITYLSMMSDQEITEYFNSSNIIVFYTPKGLEIGFNYDEGWVTVTYEDYEQYLKVF